MAPYWVLILAVLYFEVTLSEAMHCNNTDTSSDGYSPESCEDPASQDAYFNDSAYLAVIATASVVLPLIVLVRICWLKKLQKQRSSLVNRTRQQILSDVNRGRGGIFMIDIDGTPFEEIYGKPPPTYEASMCNIDNTCPPPYDPPSYNSVFPDNSYHDNQIPTTSSQQSELATSNQQPEPS